MHRPSHGQLAMLATAVTVGGRVAGKGCASRPHYYRHRTLFASISSSTSSGDAADASPATEPATCCSNSKPNDNTQPDSALVDPLFLKSLQKVASENAVLVCCLIVGVGSGAMIVRNAWMTEIIQRRYIFPNAVLLGSSFSSNLVYLNIKFGGMKTKTEKLTDDLEADFSQLNRQFDTLSQSIHALMLDESKRRWWRFGW